MDKSERRIYKNAYIHIYQLNNKTQVTYPQRSIMYNKLPATKINKQIDTKKEIYKVKDRQGRQKNPQKKGIYMRKEKITQVIYPQRL